ncbi:MAG TPA: HIT family protein [Leucothrix sp.]|nr:HIT family protein [Leucothrix sp.]
MSEKNFCPFCDGDDERIVKNNLAFAIYDTNPASLGHALIIPKRHIAEYFEASREEKIAILELIDEMKQAIDKKHAPDAYNIGVNVGEVAGQSVPHIHIHIIPRYKGDVDDPRGGVRGVIPKKQKYN